MLAQPPSDSEVWMGVPGRTAAVPAAQSDGVLVQPLGDETVIYDRESKEAHCLKPLAAVVFDCCDGHATVADIASMSTQRLGEAITDADVADAVHQLESLDLLQAAPVVRLSDDPVSSNGHGMSRREMI